MLTTSKGIATFNRIIPIITQKSINALSKKNISPEIQNNKQNDNIFFSYSNVIPNSQTESFENKFDFISNLWFNNIPFIAWIHLIKHVLPALFDSYIAVVLFVGSNENTIWLLNTKQFLTLNSIIIINSFCLSLNHLNQHYECQNKNEQGYPLFIIKFRQKYSKPSSLSILPIFICWSKSASKDRL